MSMIKIRSLVSVIPGILTLSVLANPNDAMVDDASVLKGVLDSVTVYRGQALVTRVLDVPGPVGLREIVIPELPERIQPESLFAEADGRGAVRSVRYRVRPVLQDVREEVRTIETEIRSVQDQLQALARRKQLLAEQAAYLGNLETFASTTANMELSRGVLNADTLKTLTLFMFERRETLASEELRMGLEQRDLEQRKSVLERERTVLTGTSSRLAREAVLFLNVTDPGGTMVRVRYLVDGASWSPSYNVRAERDRKNVQVEYFASIQQMSGEDWANVDMTLSTATPSLVAKAPTLAPMALTLSAQAPAVPAPSLAAREQLGKKRKDIERLRNTMQQAQLAGSSNAKQSAADSLLPQALELEFDEQLNEIASQELMLDLMAKWERPRDERKIGQREEGFSVTYELPSRTTLPSRADQQLVQIARETLPAEFYHRATPVLTTYVYGEALVTNQGSIVLLAGPASTYVEGQFVGHGEVPTVTTGEQFVVGLGINSSLRAQRELSHRTESVQGGNKSVEFTYRITVENFSSDPTKVRILDRLPTGKDWEIKTTLVSSDVKESSDANFLKSDRKKGLVRWDVEVPPRSTGVEAFGFDYKMRLEFDKGMTVVGAPVVADATR